MAKASVSFNTVEWDTVLDHLAGPGKESLARRMLVSGGTLIRDDARERSKVTHGRGPRGVHNPKGSSRSSEAPGTLASAIYLARNEKLSDSEHFTYSISWNNTIAWWGRLREFGYVTQYVVYYDEQGVFHTNKQLKLKTPRPMPAKPFLAPAFDATLPAARAAMIARGRLELPKILKGE